MRHKRKGEKMKTGRFEIGTTPDQFGRYISEVYTVFGNKVMIDDHCGTPFVISVETARNRYRDRISQGWFLVK